MDAGFSKFLEGYERFRQKYAVGDSAVMQTLANQGQEPKIMVVACCDSRVDPALILQCDPGDLFVVRNVANIVPMYEKDDAHHGTSAALEFGICFLKVKHLVLLGHSQCGGIQSLLQTSNAAPNDFISNWMSLIRTKDFTCQDPDECAKHALNQSYANCLSFPWIRDKVATGDLEIHRWFFEVKTGQVFTHTGQKNTYEPLSDGPLSCKL